VLLKESPTNNLISEDTNLHLLNELTVIPILRIFYANSQAVIKYIPQAYPKQITLFKTSKTSSMAEEDLSMGWDNLAVEKTEIHMIPGNHLTMLRKPHIQILAAQLRACIEERG
jgi:thioesterase domain-containing protein